MLIGVDFDNTIVCYDALFHREAVARGLIPADLPPRKDAIRDHLRHAGREDEWTLLQGYVYGVGIADARPFPGALEFFTRCREAGVQARIISHRTKHPVLGPQYDLHAAAIAWLQANRFFDDDCGGLCVEQTHFEVSKQDKLARITAVGCTHFVDDLPELLSAPGFPAGVRRILFDPSHTSNNRGEFDRAASWSEVTELLALRSTTAVPSLSFPSHAEPPAAAVRALLSQAGMPPTFRCLPLAGGANNRTYRVEHDDGAVLLKWYFAHPDEPRDRLQSEFAFARFAWKRGIDAVPQPLAHDAANRLGLYEFVPGRRPNVGDIDDRLIDAMLAFVRSLNDFRDDPGALALPDAAEACFSLQAHLDCVESRIERLTTIDVSSDVDRDARRFVETDLATAAQDAFAAARHRAAELDIPLDAELTRSQRCLSPSDFGYHNAVLADDGSVRFFDFEYAGWDDPAKLICDFFKQVEVPVPHQFREHFVTEIGNALNEPEMIAARVECLFPVYQIKWCCIVLNEFVATSALRRTFSEGDHRFEERKIQQLQKARTLLSAISRGQNG
ncbi:MAG: aminoglycoside phosphotransferase family protein [Planctomycetaceae bacterium]